MKKKPQALLALPALAMLLSACTLAPSYQQPQPQLESRFPGGAAQLSGGLNAAQLGWEEYFADPRLKALITVALRNNRDLKIAALNVDAVRAQYAISRAAMLPGLGVNANSSRARVAEDLSPTRNSMITQSYSVGLGVTSFELDLFGRVRSLSDAALNNYFAQMQNRDAARLSLVAAVAKIYFAERMAQENMRLAQQTLAAWEKSKKLTDLKFKAGVVSAIDVRVAQTQIESAHAAYAAAERQREQAHNALVLLLGQPVPEDLPTGLDLNRQFTEAELPVGLPSEVLTQRPDVRAAEFDLRAANANIGAARAAFFPRISLTGSLGSAGTDLARLFTGPNETWSFVPQITLPIFTWGQNKANLDLAGVRKNIAVAQYEKTVQAAFKDVADALVARRTLVDQYTAQKAASAANADRLRLVTMRFEHGISNSLELLDAQRATYAAEQARLQTQLLLLSNRADVYKALGGGLHPTSAAAASLPPQ